MQRLGPKQPGHPSEGIRCQACNKPMKAGDYTTLIILGPGDNEEEAQKCRDGKPYNSVAIEIHYSCATGIKK